MKRSFSSYYLSEAKFKLIELNQDRIDSDDNEDHDEEHLKKNHGIEDITDKHNAEKEHDANPDRQGIIRTIPKAHLIYKRTSHNGTYEEMWIYKAGSNYRDENKIRSAILDGTDIDQRLGSSTDGEQTYEIWTCNDRQIMKISGLPN
jgi:hypothetical protein